MKINEKEKKVLKVLVSFWEDDQNCRFFWWIAKETKLTIKEVRRACRSLAKKGLTEYLIGLFDDDGILCGSGYCATREGVEFLKK